MRERDEKENEHLHEKYIKVVLVGKKILQYTIARVYIILKKSNRIL